MQSQTITLDTPIKRGESEISQVELRKPSAGELRGASLTDLLQMDVIAMIKVLPRITTPTLTMPELAAMDPADLLQMGGAVASFLLPKVALADAQSQTT